MFSSDTPTGQLGHWFKEKKDQAHKSVFTLVNYLNTKQSYREEDYIKFLNLYSNTSLAGMIPTTFTSMSPDFLRRSQGGRLTFNLCQNIPDTVLSRIAKNKPKPTFITSGGNYKLQRKAKKLDMFCAGQFYETKIYEIAPRIFLDGMIFGTGICKIYRRDKEIVVERIQPNEIKIDEQDGMNGNPRSMHQEIYASREMLISDFPEYEAEISQAPAASNTFEQRVNATASNDRIKVIESWHLPSGKDKKDGRHTICVDTCTLLDESYNRKTFPFILIRWSDQPIGFWGQSLIHQLLGYQIEINKTIHRISKAIDNIANPKIFVDRAAHINKNHLTNNWEKTPIIEMNGQTPPFVMNAQSVGSDVIQHLDYIYNKAYEQSGVSQSYAHSQKPAGLNSGKALREYNDIESERFVMQGQKYEQFFIDAAALMLEIGKEIASECAECGLQKADHEDIECKYKASGYTVMAKGKDCIEMIDWKDVDMQEDKYLMQVMPTSMLSNTPAGRLEDVQELMQAGLVDQKQGYDLLDFPDLKKASGLNTASYDIIERTIESMIDGGDFISPEKYDDLQLIIELGMKYYSKARLDNVDDEALAKIQHYIDAASDLLNPPPPPADPAPPTDPTGGMGGQPPGVDPTQGMGGVPGADPTAGMPPGSPLAKGAVLPVNPMLPFRHHP